MKTLKELQKELETELEMRISNLNSLADHFDDDVPFGGLKKKTLVNYLRSTGRLIKEMARIIENYEHKEINHE